MRIAIVNDVCLAVEAVRRVILDATSHEIAWIARNGVEAVEQCARDRPDLILMDLTMPRMGGVEATRRIMAGNPCPILVVTANVDGSAGKVFEAMGAGALDAVNTPVLAGRTAQAGPDPLVAKLETIRRLIGSDTCKSISSRMHRLRRPTQHAPTLVAIGASAGGPAALAKVLAGLPADFPAPLVIVQHVDVQFAQGLADWLDFQTRLQVRLARDGDHLEPGLALLAGRDSHLVLADAVRVAYSRHASDGSYRPSINALFKSIDDHWLGDVVAALLTGMGRDGAAGLKLLRDRGHHTLAQDQATSTVYGMPKAAAQLHAATEILALDEIGPRLGALVVEKNRLYA